MGSPCGSDVKSLQMAKWSVGLFSLLSQLPLVCPETLYMEEINEFMTLPTLSLSISSSTADPPNSAYPEWFCELSRGKGKTNPKEGNPQGKK